jgi:hypothetical protein
LKQRCPWRRHRHGGQRCGSGSLFFYCRGAARQRQIFDHDGHLCNILDIAVANYGTNNIVVLFRLGDGIFLLGTLYSTGFRSQPFALATGDFNNDSRLDIAVVNYNSNNIGVFLANGTQPFGGVTTYLTGDESQPHAVAVNDLNNDGWSDVVVANF